MRAEARAIASGRGFGLPLYSGFVADVDADRNGEEARNARVWGYVEKKKKNTRVRRIYWNRDGNLMGFLTCTVPRKCSFFFKGHFLCCLPMLRLSYFVSSMLQTERDNTVIVK